MDNICAFIPAAGFGTRMQPLSNFLAKPALDFLGIPIIEWIAVLLYKSGIGDLAVNLHHLPGTLLPILESTEKRYKGLKFHKSYETKEILGTGGSHIQLNPWRSNRHLLVHNGDIFSQISIKDFVEFHLSQKKLLTLAVCPPNGLGTLALNEYRVVKLEPKPRQDLWYGAGLFMFSPEFFDLLPKQIQPLGLQPFLQKAIAMGQAVAYPLIKNSWFDLGGSPKEYLTVNLKVQKQNLFADDLHYLRAHQLTSNETLVQLENSSMKDCVLGQGVAINAPLKLSDCLIMSNTVINQPIQGKRLIISPFGLFKC